MILARPAEHMIVMVNLLVHAKKKWKTEGYITISANFGRFRMISAGICAESAGFFWFRPESEANRPESGLIVRIGASEERRRESGAGAAPILGTN